jgi:CheY-like chemotaxis protein
VDNSEIIREQLIEAFERLGVQCETAADWHEARSVIEDCGGFDIYFIDIAIPNKSGAELAWWIKSRRDGSVVVLTAMEDWEGLQDAVMISGADKGLVKPIFSSTLVDCMNECFSTSRVSHTDDNAREFAGKVMLLAEDVEINREIVMSLLEATGLVIDCAESGRAALTMMEENSGKYDIVVMDVQMPVMDGLEATRRIRALPEPWCKEIPIIAMTANVFKDDIQNCLDAGMNDHIGKPVYIDDLVEKLRTHLTGRIPTRNLPRTERRVYRRVPLDTSALLKRTGGVASSDAKVINFSVGGILIATDEKLDTDESITLIFSIDDSETVDGVVLRVNRAGNGEYEHEAAVKFENICCEQKKRFYRFTEKTTHKFSLNLKEDIK